MAALILVASGCVGCYGESTVGASYRSSDGAVGASGFYDALAPYGTWMEYGSYGWCWTPRYVGPEWRPYSEGYWVYTDYGWSWISDEPWGWAACHYGRWLFDDDEGWIWVPGTVWSSAWVAWRYDDDWVGWAALPPGPGWNASATVGSLDSDRLPLLSWCFVEHRHLLDRDLRGQVVSVARNPTLFRGTRDATRFDLRDGRASNRGLDVTVASRLIGRSVPRFHVADLDRPPRGRGSFAGARGVGFYRPVIRDAALARGPRPEARPRRQAVPEPVRRQREEEARRRLNRDLSLEQAKLQSAHERELRSRPGRAGLDQIRRSHEAENQAFAAHAARQRHVLDQRLQQSKHAAPGDARKSDPSRGKGRGRGRPQDTGKS